MAATNNGDGLHDSLSQLSLDNDSPPLPTRHLTSVAPTTPRTAATQAFAQARTLRTPPTSAATATQGSPKPPHSLKRGSISELDDSWAAAIDLEQIISSHRKKARDRSGTPATIAARPQTLPLPIAAQQSFLYDFSESTDCDQWLKAEDKTLSFHQRFHIITKRKLTAHPKFYQLNHVRAMNRNSGNTTTPESKSSKSISSDLEMDEELSHLSPSKTPTASLLSQNAETEAAIHKLFEMNRDFADPTAAHISSSQSSTSSTTSAKLSSSQSSTSSTSSSSSSSSTVAAAASLNNHRQYRAHVTAAITATGRLYGAVSLKYVYSIPADRSTRLDRRFGDRILRVTFSTTLPQQEDRWSSPTPQRISAYKLLIAQMITQPLFIAGNMYIPLTHKSYTMYYFAVEAYSLPSIDINNARNFLGNFYNINNPAKCNARMGLSLSQTYATLRTKNINILIEDDIINNNNNNNAPWSAQYMMTDGCGCMSEDISEQIYKLLPKPFRTQRCSSIPSHMQIRLFSQAGVFKGMLMTDINLPSNTIRLRKSQLKCGAPTYVEEEFLTIDVVDIARRPFHKAIQDAAQQCIQPPLIKDTTPLTTAVATSSSSSSVVAMTDITDTTELIPTARLNRQVIAMLSSRGVTNDIFFHLLEDALNDIQLSINNYHSAIKLLHLSINDDMYEDFQIQVALMLMSGHTLDEPHIRHVLYILRQRELDNLQLKTAIPCPNSAYLYALPDINNNNNKNILNEGDVFVKMNGIVLKHCYVVCGRLPCLRRNALRVLRCVDCSHLSHIDNAIVFSTRGHISEMEKMSGDYDGDKVLVIWNEQIVESIRKADAQNSNQINQNHQPTLAASFLPHSQSVVKPSPNRKLQFGQADSETIADITQSTASTSASDNHVRIEVLPAILYIERRLSLPTYVEDEYLRYEFAHLYLLPALYEFQHAMSQLSFAHLALVCDPNYGADHVYTRQVADLFDRAVNAEKTGEIVSLPYHVAHNIHYPFWIKLSANNNNNNNNNSDDNNNNGAIDYYRFKQHIITLLHERITLARLTKPDTTIIIDPETTYDHTRYKTVEERLAFGHDIELARAAYDEYKTNNRIYMKSLAENEEKNWSATTSTKMHDVTADTTMDDLPQSTISPAATMSFRQRMEEHRKTFMSSIIERHPQCPVHLLNTDVLINWYDYCQLDSVIREDIKRLASAYYLQTYTTERARHDAAAASNQQYAHSGHRLWFVWSVCPIPLHDIKLKKGDREGQPPAPPPIMLVMAQDRAPLFLSKFTHATPNKIVTRNHSK